MATDTLARNPIDVIFNSLTHTPFIFVHITKKFLTHKKDVTQCSHSYYSVLDCKCVNWWVWSGIRGDGQLLCVVILYCGHHRLQDDVKMMT